MERSNQQYLPRKKTSNIKQEKSKLQHQSQQDTEQYQQLCKKTDDLQEGLSAEQIINEKQKKLTDLENEVDSLKVTVGKKEHAIKSLREEKDDFLTRQWQREAEENAKQRCTIEHSKEQIADMSKQLEIHQQEKAYILSMANYMVTSITEINARKTKGNSCKLSRPENMSLDSFEDNMDLILNRVTGMKNEMLTTEGNIAAKIAFAAKWTDEQRQIEEGLNQEIQDKAKTIHEQDMQLDLMLSRIQETEKINSAYEGMKNENNKLRQQIFDNQRKPDQQQRNQSHKLEVENDGLRRSLNHMNTELQQGAAHNESLQRTLQDLTYQINKKDEQIQDVKRETDDLRPSLNQMNTELQQRAAIIESLQRTLQDLTYQINKKDEQIRDAKRETDDLRTSLIHMKTELQQREAHTESLQRAIQDLTYQINKKDKQIQDVKRETDDLRTRLDSLAGDELTKDTPANTALGDPNRPTKIAEKYGELYDNEWTDAIDCTVEVKALYPEMKTAGIEEVIIRNKYQLVMCCYRECLALSKEQLKDVGNMIVNALKLNTKRHGTNIPCCKEVSNIRRQGAAEYADYLFQHKVIVDKIVLSDWEYVHKSKELFGLLTQTPFFEKCIHLCWHMAIKDPVMHLDEELTPDTAYDKSVYREFAKCGDKVTFVVWPALFLHEGGPLLNKGVVQAYC